MNIIWRPSLNFKTGNSVQFIVLHFTAGGIEGSLETLTKPGGLSSHYVISKKGEIYKLVQETNIAYHAGKSSYGDLVSLNNYSIGIEIENWGDLHKDSSGKICRWTGAEHTDKFKLVNMIYWDYYPFIQLHSVVELVKNIKTRYPNIKIVGHDQIAFGRKSDPGAAFPWDSLLTEV